MKIDLKAILTNEINRVAFPNIDDWIEDDTTQAKAILEVMSIVWNTAVDG